MIDKIKQDFMSYNVVIKKGKRTIFDDEIYLTDSKTSISNALVYSLGQFLKSNVEYFEIPNLDFLVLPSEKNIEKYGKDNLLFLNDDLCYVKAHSIEPTDCRYSLKNNTFKFMNNTFPNWNYLDKKFSISISLIIDEKGLEKALSLTDYKPVKKESNLIHYRDLNNEDRYSAIFI